MCYSNVNVWLTPPTSKYTWEKVHILWTYVATVINAKMQNKYVGKWIFATQMKPFAAPVDPRCGN